MSPFQVVVDRGIRQADGSSSHVLDPIEQAGVSWRFLDELVEEMTPEQLDGQDAVLVAGASVTDASLRCENPPLLIARMGAGFDTVPVPTCTDRGILVTTAPDGVRGAMGTSGVLLALALAHRLVEKDKRTRAGIWDRSVIGHGLGGRTFGVLGLGNIGREVCRLAAPFPWRRIGHDAYAPPVDGVESVQLDTLFAESDYLVVTLPLTEETHHIVGTRTLALMRPTAQLVNIARGPVVDQQALTEALAAGRLAGAALDVFDPEPLPVEHPLIAMDNVILTGHDAGLTADMTADTARSVCRSVIEVARGQVPAMLLNREVLGHPRLASLQRPSS